MRIKCPVIADSKVVSQGNQETGNWYRLSDLCFCLLTLLMTFPNMARLSLATPGQWEAKPKAKSRFPLSHEKLNQSLPDFVGPFL